MPAQHPSRPCASSSPGTLTTVLSDGVRRVLRLAQKEARVFRHSHIGTEHILLGLMHDGEGLAAKALGSLGISLESVYDELEKTIGLGDNTPAGSLPFTLRAKKVIELSAREAHKLGHNSIRTEHLLLALVREREGVAAQVLVALGVDLGAVRQRVIELIPLDLGQHEAREGLRNRRVPGASKRIDVVRLGRGPWVYEATYDELARLLAEEGVDIDTVDPRSHPGAVRFYRRRPRSLSQLHVGGRRWRPS